MQIRTKFKYFMHKFAVAASLMEKGCPLSGAVISRRVLERRHFRKNVHSRALNFPAVIIALTWLEAATFFSIRTESTSLDFFVDEPAFFRYGRRRNNNRRRRFSFYFDDKGKMRILFDNFSQFEIQ